MSRLKALTKAFREIGKELINIELKGYEDQSKV